MSETRRIADQLRRSYQGIAWHGPSLKEALEGVTADMAANRSAPGIHTIEELVVHVSTWAELAHRFLVEGTYVNLADVEDWAPAPGDWAQTLDALGRAQQTLWEEVKKLPDERLNDIVSAEKKYSTYILLHGVIQHNLYHAGQISLLKKLAVP